MCGRSQSGAQAAANTSFYGKVLKKFWIDQHIISTASIAVTIRIEEYTAPLSLSVVEEPQLFND